ncbi:hypothetical protein CDR68_06665 [Salmonella enterica]|nr:hypothetical protein [Salmonella enterica]
MINTDDFIKHIGRGYKDLLLVEFLDRLHIYDLPFTPEEDEAFSDYPAVAYANSRDSRIVEIERYSMHMIYEDREKYALLYNENVEDSFVLKELVFYSDGIQDFMGFKGKLPFGISMEGHRTELHSNKNMRFIASRKYKALRKNDQSLENYSDNGWLHLPEKEAINHSLFGRINNYLFITIQIISIRTHLKNLIILFLDKRIP